MPEPQTAPLRILEVGGDMLFGVAAPDQTSFFWAATRPDIGAEDRGKRALGPLRFLRALGDLRAGRYDLMVIHAPQYAPWSARSLLQTLRDWTWRAPLGLFALFACRWLCRFHDTPIAVVDLGDSFGLGRHTALLLDRCRLFFKRELPADHWQAFHRSGHRDFPGARWRGKARPRRWIEKLRPLSYGVFYGQAINPPDYPTAEKTADIFFAGAVAANNTVRATGLAELKQLAAEGYKVDIPDAPLPLPEFLKRMAGAWLAWSPAGLGWECARHYEAPLARTVPLMNVPTILRDRPLRHGEGCILYEIEPGGLAAAARAALSDKPRLQVMAEAAHDHVATHHSWRARAEHIAVSVLGRRLDGTLAADTPPSQPPAPSMGAG